MRSVLSISSSQVISAYKNYIDVSSFFQGIDTLTLYEHESGLLQWHPIIPGDALFYDLLSKKVKPYYPSHKTEYKVASTLINSASQILEIGCGSGQFAKYVSAANWLGIDLNESAVNEAIDSGLNAICFDFESGDLDVLPHQSFEYVVSFQTIEHLSDPSTLFNFASKVLTPGGKLILGGPAHNSLLGTDPCVALNLPPHHLTWWPDSAYFHYPSQFGFNCDSLIHCPLDSFHNNFFLGSLFNSIISPSFESFPQPISRTLTTLFRRLALLPLKPFISNTIPLDSKFGIHGQSVVAIYSLE